MFRFVRQGSTRQGGRTAWSATVSATFSATLRAVVSVVSRAAWPAVLSAASPAQVAGRDDQAWLMDEAKARASRLRREAIRDGVWVSLRGGQARPPRPSRAQTRLQARLVQHARQRAAHAARAVRAA